MELIIIIIVLIWGFNAYWQYKELPDYKSEVARVCLSILLPVSNLCASLIVWVKKREDK